MVSVSFWDSPVVIAFLTVTLPLLVNQWFQAKKTRDVAKSTADEVKADLTIAKTEIQADAQVRKETLNTVERHVNGDRAAKEARIRVLEAKLREHGIEG